MTLEQLSAIKQRYANCVDADGSISVCADLHQLLEEDIPAMLQALTPAAPTGPLSEMSNADETEDSHD